jgi:hypothetical protein
VRSVQRGKVSMSNIRSRRSIGCGGHQSNVLITATVHLT